MIFRKFSLLALIASEKYSQKVHDSSQNYALNPRDPGDRSYNLTIQEFFTPLNTTKTPQSILPNNKLKIFSVG